jgi:hypothetical protein
MNDNNKTNHKNDTLTNKNNTTNAKKLTRKRAKVHQETLQHRRITNLTVKASLTNTHDRKQNHQHHCRRTPQHHNNDNTTTNSNIKDSIWHSNINNVRIIDNDKTNTLQDQQQQQQQQHQQQQKHPQH